MSNKNESEVHDGIADTRIFIRCRDEIYMEVSNQMESLEKEKLCTGVFKDGSNTTTKEKLTQKWIELINRLEKGKTVKVEMRT